MPTEILQNNGAEYKVAAEAMCKKLEELGYLQDLITHKVMENLKEGIGCYMRKWGK